MNSTRMSGDDQTEPARHTSWPTRRVVVIVVVAMTLLVLAFGWRWWSDRSYVGTAQRVALDWDCWNGIVWIDAGNGVRWWAGHDPLIVGTVETAPRTANNVNGIKHATGTIRFDTVDTAVFTSDRGGTIALTRDPPGTVHTADCTTRPGG